MITTNCNDKNTHSLGYLQTLGNLTQKCLISFSLGQPYLVSQEGRTPTGVNYLRRAILHKTNKKIAALQTDF